MRLKTLSLKNFRCFPDEKIDFGSYCALVGANNAGKSAVVAAIDIFFRSHPKRIPITIDDFYKRDPKRELKIELTFSDLDDKALDAFSHYARSGDLTFFIKANIDGINVKASIHGMRFANPQFAPFFEMGNATDKKQFYESLSVANAHLPSWKNQNQAAEALRAFENANPSQNSPIASGDNAFGIEGPVKRLKQFIDFVYIPAVKDAEDEAIEASNTAFSRLVDRAVRANLNIDERIEKIRKIAKIEIDSIAKEHEKVLLNLASKIDQEYRKFNSLESKIHLEWGDFDDENLEISLPSVHLQVSDDLIRNSIGKFGHGTQRNYLMALLMVSASYDFTESQALIIACEEPELYQHPPQARVLASALSSLASDKTQIIVTTHSPYFITSKAFENIRLVRRTRGLHSRTYSWSADENCSLIAKAKGEKPIGAAAALAAINQFLQNQINEMFFAPCVIFVEGEEDKAIIGKYFSLSGKQKELLMKGVSIIPTNGKGNLINALSMARGFEIPFFAVFDGDMNLSETKEKTKNLKLNKNIMAIIDYKGDGNEGTFDSDIIADNFCAWKNCIQTAFSSELIKRWEEEKRKVCEEFGWTIERLRKNAMVLEATLTRIYDNKPIPHLDKLCDAVIAKFSHAKSMA